MDPTIVGIICIAVLLILIAMRMPVSFSMAITGFLGYSYLFSLEAAYRVVSIDFYYSFTSYSLATAPMFILMGYIAYYTGVGADVYNLANKLVGHVRGGLLVATQLACGLFGAISGSLLASVATIGNIALPQMKRLNYNLPTSAACIVAGSSLGSLIPPSIILVVYGITAEQSIGRLLIAGIIPGIIHMTLYIITVQLLSYFNPSIAPAVPKANWSERISAFGGGLVEVVLVFMITMGGLLVGWFTPTEAGAVGAFCLFIITLLRKRMNWEKTISSLRSSTYLTAQIFFLVASAKVFGRFIAVTRIPFEFASFIQSVDIPPFLVVLAIMFISMLLGCIIDAMPLILLIIPVFLPVIENLGYDPIWFGIQIVVVCSMGILTPPVGIGIYIIKGIIPDVPIQNIFKNIWPFLLTDWAFAIILVIFPSIATFLPGLLF